MIGLVTSVRPVDDRFMHSVLTTTGRCAVIHDTKFSPGSWVEFSGSENKLDKDTKEVRADSMKEIPEDGKERQHIEAHIKKICKPRKAKFMIDDEVTNKLLVSINDAAEMIKKAEFLHRPIIVRFDNDTDGLCAGLAMHDALPNAYFLKIQAQEVPFYKKMHVDEDLRYINSLEGEHLPPLLVCVDFGSNPESMEGYRIARENGFSIVVIDHHPIQDQKIKQFMDVFVSAWNFLSDGATEYTAGFVASEVAKRITKGNDAEMERLARIAMSGDRSKLIKSSEKDKKYSEAIMFTISTSKYEQTIEGYSRFINDEEMVDFAYAQADEKIQNILERLPSHTKRKTKGDVTFFLVDAGRLCKKGQYPGRSSVANIAADQLIRPLQTPAAIFSYNGRNVSLRLNPPALKQGYSSLAAIMALKKSIPEYVEAGGGHAVSASIRIRVGKIKEVLSSLITEISSQKQ